MSTTLPNGLTLRDYFAGQALAGEMASQREGAEFAVDEPELILMRRAFLCYRLADVMLKAKDLNDMP